MTVSSKLPLITIGILNFNGLAYLKRTIPTIVTMEYPNYEVVIVDNGSQDGSIEFLEKHDKVKLIQNQENLGYCKGKNAIVDHAQGEYILLLDEDLQINDRDALQRLLEIYRKHNAAFLTVLLQNDGATETAYIGGFWGWFAYGVRPKWPVEKITNYLEEIIPVHAPEGQALFFEKRLFNEIGRYDELQPYYLDVGDLGIRSNVLTNRTNYCYLKMCFVHLGIHRRDDIKRWAWNLSYMFPGAMRMLLKNFTIWNVIRFTPTIFLFYFGGSLIQTVKRRSLLIIRAFLWSVYFFFKSLPDTLEKRRAIQSKRVAPTDEFLRIKRPSF